MIYGKWTECMYSVEPKVYEAHKKSKKAGADSKKLKEVSAFGTALAIWSKKHLWPHRTERLQHIGLCNKFL